MTESVSRTSLRRKLLIAAGAILVVLVAIVILGPVMLGPGFNRPKPTPALATVERRSFSAVATAAGALTRAGSGFVLWAPFSQADAARLQVGQSGTVTVDALPGQSFASTVTLIETGATQVNGVPEYFAESTLTTTDPRLRNGQTATVNVVVAGVSNVLAVPTQALFNGASGALQVDVWYQDAPVATTVVAGLSGPTLTEIKSGPQQGEQVMLAPVGETLQPPAPSPT